MSTKRILGLTMAGVAVASMGALSAQAALIRGPYLQIGTATSMVVRWRTDVAEDSRVRWGQTPGALTNMKDDATITTEHEVTIEGLAAGTAHYYEVGSTTTALAGDDLNHVFRTAPPTGTSQPTRIWAIGDSGYPDPGTGALPEWIRDGDAVRDAYTAFNGGVASADVFLLLGDNAYTFATDAEYQTDLFEQYPGFMRTTPAWACIGNHEGFVADSVLETGDYYSVFTLPAAAEAGGVASGTESYYAFDYGNIHFVVLDSEDSIEQPAATATMQEWLEADLAATEADWLIAFWHRPPYSRGLLHDSDIEQNEIDMRVHMNPILEDYGVDFVLSGHSHNYERSFLIDGHYGLSGTFGPEHVVDGGTGDPMVDNAYEKTAKGLSPHTGTVYVVAGSASEVRPGIGNHPVMAAVLESLGSFILDVDGQSATATFLDETGTVLDTFEMNKAAACPATPVVGCTAAGKAKLLINDKERNRDDKFLWQAKSMNVDPADVGDPTDSANIDICGYDSAGRLFAVGLPAGTATTAWKESGSGFFYKDKESEVAGIKIAKVKTRTGGGQIFAKGKGVNLFVPGIPLTLPVTVQAKNDATGGCWESVFAPGDVVRNEPGKFLAKK